MAIVRRRQRRAERVKLLSFMLAARAEFKRDISRREAKCRLLAEVTRRYGAAETKAMSPRLVSVAQLHKGFGIHN
jgi:hypothetical protein